MAVIQSWQLFLFFGLFFYSTGFPLVSWESGTKSVWQSSRESGAAVDTCAVCTVRISPLAPRVARATVDLCGHHWVRGLHKLGYVTSCPDINNCSDNGPALWLQTGRVCCCNEKDEIIGGPTSVEPHQNYLLWINRHSLCLPVNRCKLFQKLLPVSFQRGGAKVDVWHQGLRQTGSPESWGQTFAGWWWRLIHHWQEYWRKTHWNWNNSNQM